MQTGNGPDLSGGHAERQITLTCWCIFGHYQSVSNSPQNAQWTLQSSDFHKYLRNMEIVVAAVAVELAWLYRKLTKSVVKLRIKWIEPEAMNADRQKEHNKHQNIADDW